MADLTTLLANFLRQLYAGDLSVADDATIGGQLLAANGTAADPSISFTNDPDSGVYRITTNTVGVSAGGTVRSYWSGSGFVTTSLGFDTSNLDVTISRQSAGTPVINGGTATPAGGSTGLRLVFGSTAGFGVYVGSGVPTVSAAQGSLYLRSDGSSTSTRAYINTDGATTWTAVTTAT